jgi:hypothetical protein
LHAVDETNNIINNVREALGQARQPDTCSKRRPRLLPAFTQGFEEWPQGTHLVIAMLDDNP